MVKNPIIKKWYKQTEIGIIPEDWGVEKLGNIGDTIIGLTYSPRDVSMFGTLVHRSSNIQNNRLSFNDNVYVKKNIDEKLILKEGDILICVRNGSRDLVGKSALIKGLSVGETFGAFMSIFRTNENYKFVLYLIQSDLVQKQINQNLGATINQITNKTLNSFQIPFPKKSEEQSAIASVLSDTDELIEYFDNLITKKKAIKQGTLQQLLTGKKRLPGFSRDWEEKKLNEIWSFSKGQGIRKNESQSGDIPCIRYGELYTKHNNIIKQCYSFISKNVAETAKLIKAGDILFAGSWETKEEIGKCATFIDNFVAYAGGDIVIFSPYDSNSIFLGYLLNSPAIVRQKASKGQGDAVVHISASSLKEVIIFIPSDKKEQSAIATVLFDMDEEIHILEMRRDKYRDIKLGMMQQLLTGNIRVYGNK